METKTQLCSKNVKEVFFRCRVSKTQASSFRGIGLQNDIYFSNDLLDHKQEIKDMLLELPYDFKKSSGSKGASFLESNFKNTGRWWTMMFETAEMLFAMGHALGLVEFPVPREMWFTLEQELPILIVNDTKCKADT
ncbi:MAG: hypothetical protein JWM20_563 [Patescibacteria group bacterium]|nr:hypothetical protein [Patescibacteria group bacterium]